MALLTKPNMQQIWASGGDIVEPSDLKKQQGWTVEVPPHQFENWVQNRQDEYLAHINQRGIPAWDGLTDYEAGGLSYVQGSDGIIYKSEAASGPTTTVQNPTTDVSDTYWTIAFSPNAVASETVRGLVELATNAETQAGTDTERAVTPAALSSRTATETRTGLVEIATTAEAEAGTDDVRAMTPLKVKQAIDQFATSTLPLGYFSGFTLANNSGAPNSTIDIGAGAARNSTNTVDIISSSTTSGILQSSGSWTAGNNQNKLDTGSRANSTTYHVFKIYKTSDGTSEDLFSLSATTPTMPSGYAGFRRIGRIATDGSGNIRAFKDRGNGYFDWVAPVIEATVVSTAPGSANLTITGMGGAPVRARLQGFISGDAAAIKFTATDVPNIATGAATSDWTGGHVAQAGGGSANETGASEFEVSTDTSGQVIVRYYSGTGNAGYRVINFGWQEIR